MTIPSALERLEPAPPADAISADVPVKRVTLLEDRAQIQRSGKVTLKIGQNRVLIPGTATVIQNVSLRAEVKSGKAQVVDVRTRRSLRVRLKDRPEAARALEQQIEALQRRHQRAAEEHTRGNERYARIQDILSRGLDEIPVDAGWGLLRESQWKDTLEGLFKRARALRSEMQVARFAMEDASREINALAIQRQALDRPDQAVVAWIEVDVLATENGVAELNVEYVVPNALWRPLHSAQLLEGGKLRFSSSAAVWQSTGEDWKDAELVFSTARSSLGTEPPLLSDDLVGVKKKNETVVVQARQVVVQKAGMGSAPAPSGAVDLPGVDDGGEVRNLRAQEPASVPSDGRPCIIPLFTFESPAETALVTFPELDTKAFVRSIQRNEAPHPILAGPVELLMKNGFVGWTQALFVAPKERFELSFGPDDAVRLLRKDKRTSETDHVDKWKRDSTSVTLFISNLAEDVKALEVTERIPVSEIEHVRIELRADDTTHNPKVDEHGMVRWKLELPAQGHLKVMLVYRVSTAPGVQGL